MRVSRRTILAGIASVVLPMTGLVPHALTAIIAVQRQAARLADEASQHRSSDFTEPGIHIRSAPNTAALVQGVGNPGDSVTLHDKVIGETIVCAEGVTTSEWFHIADHRTLIYGYVSGCYV